MYDNHVPLIAAAMRASPDTFARGCMFAILSARVPFYRVPGDLLDLDRDKHNCRALWSWKGAAYTYIEANKVQLWRDTFAEIDPARAILVLTRVPGLGLVKAAFVLQLAGYNIACLDVRNIVTDKRNPRDYRSDGEARKLTAAFQRKACRYVTDTEGKARFYWNRWCHEVAASYGMAPEECSALHLSIVPRGFRLPSKKQELKTALLNDTIPF